MAEVEVYIGLGANLGEPKQNLKKGLAVMAKIPGYTPDAVSSPYKSAPVGPQDQPHFVNAVARGMFNRTPHELLRGLLEVETALGRVREIRWGPRTLDLDILLFGRQVIRDPDLAVPHPEMPKRAFVLVPLAELAKDLVLPLWQRTAGQLLAEMDPLERASQEMERISWE